MNEFTEITAIKNSIAKYAKAYEEMESHQQQQNPLIPKCDQKTGAIGEFYSMIYAKSIYSNIGDDFSFGNPSQHAWDIKISKQNKSISKIQVKTVSGFSKSSTISPIHKGWDELWLLRLNKEFFPEGFWIIKDSSWITSAASGRSKKMPRVENPNCGSAVFNSRVNYTSQLLKVLEEENK